jgi:general secretion pathway protein E
MPKQKKHTKTPRAPKPPASAPAAAPTQGDLLEMDDAIALLKTTRPTFYRWLRAGKLKGMKVGREWRFYRADIERFLKGEEPRIDVVGDVAGLVATLVAAAKSYGVKEWPAAGDHSILNVVNLILALAASIRASDIHLQPHSGGDDSQARLRFRIDGTLHDIASFDPRLLPPIVERLKTMAGCNLQEKRRPQDGRIQLTIRSEAVDLRISFVPALLGEAVTLRILRRGTETLRLDKMGFPAPDDQRIRHAISLPWGLVLVTGPTGSGKTTVLYALLNELNTPGRKVMSVEDPVEYSFPGVVQIPVNLRENLTFPAALRSVLRSDPDVVLVGELRDGETANLCAQISLTGHLAMTTLHTDEAVSALMRLGDLGLNVFMIIDTVKLIVAQRLVRVLCKKCSEPTLLAPDQLEMASRLARVGGKPWGKVPAELRKPVGCRECSFTGFRGRMAVVETLVITPALAAALRARTPVDELRRIAVAQGMTTMMADGLDRAARGLTTVEEVLRTLPHGD